jgi:hypothetical protein
MSAVQSRLGEAAAKLRPTRSGAGTACLSRRVVCVSLSHAGSGPVSQLFASAGQPASYRTAHSQSSKLGMDAWVAVDPAAPVMDLLDLLGERGIFPGPLLGERPIFPGIVTAPRDRQYPAQQRDRVVGLLLRSMSSNSLTGSRLPWRKRPRWVQPVSATALASVAAGVL